MKKGIMKQPIVHLKKFNMLQRIVLGVFFFISILSVNAQSLRKTTINNNSWFMYFGDHKVSSKWGLHLETQLRRNSFLKNPQQLLLRTGINYHFNANAFATVGYCFVETYPYGEYTAKATFPENRFWEQCQVKNPLGKLEMVSRFRLEQRFIKQSVLINNVYKPGDAVFQNRMRLLNRFSLPFKGKTIADRSFYISVYDEVMFNFGKKVAYNVFDQNRAYGAIGYKIPKLGRLELGYMQQLSFKSDGVKVENNHTLQIGLSSTLDFLQHHKL
jgi:hypothetical protein